MRGEGFFSLGPNVDAKSAVGIQPNQSDVGSLESLGIRDSGLTPCIIDDEE
jgi:hypothetical protein